MFRRFLFLIFLAGGLFVSQASPVTGLLERIDVGASKKFIIEKRSSSKDFFELEQCGDKVAVRGNNYVSIATGIHWYLKYVAGIHLTWNNMKAALPEILPEVPHKIYIETDIKYRYAYNYCTFSYSMAFWDWNRWEQEIDWMAMHGVNLSLALTGTECVWRNVLQKLGYRPEEINDFIAGPAFMAWWLMNNLEGWGGPNPERWYSQQQNLQKKILKRMREYGISPVLPGYCGMVPSNAKEKLGLNVANPGKWCSYNRPAFLQPEDGHFQDIAALYYKELDKLYGKADFYAMDPFHEGGNVAGVNLEKAGHDIMAAMKQTNPKAVWVIQAWQVNPRPLLIDNLKRGDLLVLDLHSECRPQWGDPASEWYRKDGYGHHDWVYCMLLNFGGNVGLHGRMDALINGYYKAKKHLNASQTLKGVGMTAEGIENNPVMYELLYELPWRKEKFSLRQWLEDYVYARYGCRDSVLLQVWNILGKTIYNSPQDKVQQGTTESIFCARPDLQVTQASSWAETKDYYKSEDIIKAAVTMASVADKYSHNSNYVYDLIDIMRQALAEKGRLLLKAVKSAYDSHDLELFTSLSNRFLDLILSQDELLGTHELFRLGNWLEQARNLGCNEEEKNLYVWNAKVQISTWGNRSASDDGGLHDYAHKEWNGILKDLYYKRWSVYFEALKSTLQGGEMPAIDYYALEQNWVQDDCSYSREPEGNSIEVVKKILNTL